MNLEDLFDLAKSRFDGAPHALKEFQQKHARLLHEKGLATDPEHYKFTNMTKFFEQVPAPVKQGQTQSPSDQFAPTFHILNGVLKKGSALFEGIKMTPLKEAATLVPSQLYEDGPLSHLHHGLLSDGLILEVPKNFHSQMPIVILHEITQAGVQAPTIIVKMEALSQLCLIEVTQGSDHVFGQVSETYVVLQEGSNLEHIQIDKGQKLSHHHGSTWAKVEKDASYKNFIFNLSGKMNRRNLNIQLIASGADAQSYNLFLTHEDEHSDINTVINHEAADTTSNQVAKGILSGESKGIFTGKIHIHPNAQRVASGQINRNLLLSKKAQIHSQPQLEIFADDVKCSHGSTTGQLSDEELFYFESRGIPASRARTLLAHGFALEIVLKVENKKAQAMLSDQVLETLEEKFHLNEGGL